MSPKQQKGKRWKRPRSWHHGPNQDHIFDEAVRKLDAVSDPVSATPSHPSNVPKNG